MVDYSSRDRRTIQDVFDAFREQDVRFVVPRGYRGLPESVPGGDIDVVVHEDDYQSAIAACEEHGLDASRSRLDGLVSLGKDAASKPKRAVELLVTDPKEPLSLVKGAVTTSDDPDDRIAAEYDERKPERGDLMVHLMNHLAYTSPHNGSTVRVDPEVERLLHERSVRVEGFYVPSPPDELAHLVCRGVFDYEGTFPDHYVEHCDALVEEVFDSPELTDQFEDLVSLLFFDADTVVLEDVERREYDEIKSDLIRYAGY